MEQVSSALSAVGDRIRGDKAARAAAIVLGVAAAGFATRWLLLPRDGPMTSDQLAFADPIVVDTPAGKKRVRRATPADAAGAADTLSYLAQGDPMMVACAAAGMSAAERQQAMRWVQGAVLSVALPSQSGAICLQTERQEAVAIWLPKGGEVDPAQILLAGGWQFSFRYTGWERRGRLDLWSSAVQPRRRRIMAAHAGAFYYLMLAAVRRDAADADACLRAVVLPVLQRADAQGVPCYYECTDPSLLAPLKSLGFKVVEDFTFFEVPVAILRRSAVVEGRPVSPPATPSRK